MSPICIRSKRWASRSRATFPRLDILVNNAGISGPEGPLHQLAPADWDQVFNTNLRGVYYCIRSLAPLMIKARSGHIINISSLAGKNPVPGLAAYSASKWGLNGLTYSVAEELRAHNIRVVGHLSRIGAHRVQRASRKTFRQDAASVGRRPRRSHAGDPGSAIVRQRSSAAANAEALASRAACVRLTPVEAAQFSTVPC